MKVARVADAAMPGKISHGLTRLSADKIESEAAARHRTPSCRKVVLRSGAC